MHQLRVFSLSLAVFGALALLVGCGGSDEAYYIPTDHSIRPFAPPETEDLGGEDMEAEEPAAEPAPAAAPAPEADSGKTGKAAKPRSGDNAGLSDKAGAGEKAPATSDKKAKAK